LGVHQLSHVDARWAAWLHKSLETYRIPKTLVGTMSSDGLTAIPRRLFPLFRDRDELAGASSLGDKIEGALQASRNLIVICSAHAARSKWVNQEITAFKASGREQRIFCLIVDGEPNATALPASGLQECFPEAIRYVVDAAGRITDTPAEPIAADLRQNGDGKRNALLKVLAGVLDVDFDSLKQRDHDRRIRQFTIAGVALSAAVVVLAGLSYYAFLQKGAAEREARAARAALAGQLATHAQLNLQTFPRRSLLLGVEALQTTTRKGEPAVAAAEQALRQALAASGGQVFSGHQKPIASVSVSPDGRWLVTSEVDGLETRLWDLSRADATPRVLQGGGASAAISPDGRWLVTGGDNVPTRLWNLTQPEPGVTSLSLADSAAPFAFSADHRWLVTSGAAQSVRLWDLRAIDPHTQPIVLPAQINPVTVFALSRDSRWLVTSSWNRDPHAGNTEAARVWDLTALKPGTQSWELKGNTSSISNVVFSVDGHWLATSSAEFDRHTFRVDGNIYLWDLTRKDPWSQPIILKGHEGRVTAMAVSPDNHWLATGSQDKTVRVWNLSVPDPAAHPKVFSDLDEEATGVMIGPGGWLVTIAGIRASFRSLNGGDTEPKATVFEDGGRSVAIQSFQLSPEGRWLLVGSTTSAYVLDLQSTDPSTSVRALRGHEGAVTAAGFSADGHIVVTGSEDRTARRWTLAAAKLSANPLVLPAGDDESFSVSHDSRWLLTISASGDGDSGSIAALWDLTAADAASGPVLLRGLSGSVADAAFSPDGAWVAIGGDGGSARLWRFGAGGPDGTPIELRGHTGVVSTVVFSPNGRWVATGSFDGTVRLWRLNQSDPSSNPVVLQTRGASVFGGVVISANSHWLATAAGGDTTPLLWDLSSPDPARSSRPLLNSDERFEFSPDGRWLATFGSDEKRAVTAQVNSMRQRMGDISDVEGKLKLFREINDLQKRGNDLAAITTLWDLSAPNPDAAHPVLKGAGGPKAFSPDGHWLLSAGEDEVPRLWSLIGGHPTVPPIELRGHEQGVDAGAFSSDSHWLMTGGNDGTARRWNLRDKDVGHTSRLLARHASAVSTIAISPDNRLVLTASSSDDAPRLQLLNGDETAESVVLPIGISRVRQAAFTADARRLITTSNDDHTVSVWAMELDELVRLACRVASRDLTGSEWQQYFAMQSSRPVCLPVR
jgi:WD40 repeat protein